MKHNHNKNNNKLEIKLDFILYLCFKIKKIFNKKCSKLKTILLLKRITIINVLKPH